MRLRNAGGVRGVTMVPEADGDDSRRWSGGAAAGERASTRQVLRGLCWRCLGGTATRGDLHAVIGRGIWSWVAVAEALTPTHATIAAAC